MFDLLAKVALPANRNDLAFYNVTQLAALIKSKKITVVELTRFFIDRLKQHGDKLHCVISLQEETALQQARLLDEEIKKGKYRGVLHGIPYGVKDLLAISGTKTTWGAAPYKEQVINETATVVEKLNNAGCVMLAKLSMGELAMDDEWYGGLTRNPWDLNEGSSGSSAGSAAAVSAGLLPFAIGTETWGSIISPSTRCGITGLRPTFGRVSRYGAMALSWTMDKIGAMAHTAQDCAIVLNTMGGKDNKDPYSVQYPFNYNAHWDVKKLKVGYLKNMFYKPYAERANDSATLEQYRKLGMQLQPVSWNTDSIPVDEMSIILFAEASAAFEELTLTNKDDMLARQFKGAWPNYFRSGQLIPAAQYIQASRHRTLLQQRVYNMLKDYDVVICPTWGGNQLLVTNLTGNPAMCFPNGFTAKGKPTSITLIGNLYEEGKLVALAQAFQNSTAYNKQHPPAFQ